MGKMKKIVNVANRLPIIIGDTIQRSSGGLVAAMESLGDSFDMRWVGWAGAHIDEPAKREALSRQIKERFNYTAIFLGAEDAAGYYDGFSNASMWPLLHYMITYSKYEHHWYRAYKKVNRIFCEAVVKATEPGDIVWIHDYHLMLLPSMIREAGPGRQIGFFLHTPFPSSEIFRCHPQREQLLQGLLGADLIGFHTFGYLRHFRSTVLHVLGIESEIEAISHEHNRTAMGVFPIGINAAKFSKALQSDSHAMYLSDFRTAHQAKRIVLSVERLDYTKGIPQRLDAIEQFLEMDVIKDDIVFIFISVPSREDVQAYQSLVEEVQGRVSQINGRFSTIKNVPVHFIHQSVEFEQLCALYAIADVCVVTPLIDGMNLVAKEYIACQTDKSGVLILSEFAGAAQELPHALIVNPYNTQQMVDSLIDALRMPEEEKKRRMAAMREKVLHYDAKHWAKFFLDTLTRQVQIGSKTSLAIAVTAGHVKALVHANRIGLFLDYDGTLTEIQKNPSAAYPREETLALLTRLEKAQDIDVYIVSGRKREDLQKWFQPYNFTLVAEHGFFCRMSGEDEWQVFDENIDLSWMERIIEIFQVYSGTTPGASVEVKTASIVWHYRESDPEFGTWKANQLAAELYELLSNLPVEIHHGKKIVEVSSIRVNKGIVLDRFFAEHHYPAAICAGDDETDESMFRMADERVLTIKIGEGHTAARFRMEDPAELRRFLTQLLAERKGRSLSDH